MIRIVSFSRPSHRRKKRNQKTKMKMKENSHTFFDQKLCLDWQLLHPYHTDSDTSVTEKSDVRWTVSDHWHVQVFRVPVGPTILLQKPDTCRPLPLGESWSPTPWTCKNRRSHETLDDDVLKGLLKKREKPPALELIPTAAPPLHGNGNQKFNFEMLETLFPSNSNSTFPFWEWQEEA